MAETITALSDQLVTMLQEEKLVILNTIDFETGAPITSAISWVYAVDPQTIRFAVDQRSRIVSNLKNNPLATVTFFGAETVNAVYGETSFVKNELDEVPFKLACIDLKIDTIRDAMFYGAKISVEPEYEKTYDIRAAEKLDHQVYAAMKKA